MQNLNSKKVELQAKIAEMEETLAHLKQQLQSEIEADQHAAIDNLDEYLGQLDHKYDNLRVFWETIKEEFAQLLSSASNKEDKS